MATIQKVTGLLAGIALCWAPASYAQSASPATERFFVNVNVGGQLADRSIASTAAPQLIHGETATMSSSQLVNRGMLIDVGGGVRVWGDLFVGVVLTRYQDTEDAQYTASVPDPLFFNRSKTSAGEVTGLNRTELGAALTVGMAFPLTDKLDVVPSVGAILISLEQDLVAGFSVPVGTQVVSIRTESQKGQAVGPYAAVDVIYGLTSKIGVGGYVRYAGAKVDLTTAKDQNVGGVMVGGGVRLKF